MSRKRTEKGGKNLPACYRFSAGIKPPAVTSDLNGSWWICQESWTKGPRPPSRTGRICPSNWSFWMGAKKGSGGCPWHVPSAGVHKGILLVSPQDPSHRVILVSFRSNGRDIGGRTTLRLSPICSRPSQNPYLPMRSEWLAVLTGLYSTDTFFNHMLYVLIILVDVL